IDDATLDTLQGEVDAQASYWQERFDAETHLRADLDTQRRALQDATAYLEGLRDRVRQRLAGLTFDEKRALLLALVDRIWVDGDNRLTIEGIIRDDPAAHPDGYVADCSTALSRASM
ncbi:MAG: hypothetical protein ACRDJN_00990, partial [Chloroflexota bacterium]